MEKIKVPIIIPSYEPDNRLIEVCKELVTNQLEDIIVVDDGSGEDYQKIFEKLKDFKIIKIIHHRKNMGKGRAIKTAIKYILDSNELVLGCITADSDGQHTVRDIKACIGALETNPDSLILGIRDFNEDQVPLRSKLGNKITRFVFNFISGKSITDTQTGLRAIPYSLLEWASKLEGERFEYEMNMLLDLADTTPLVEVEIETVYESKDNHKSHFNTIKDSFLVYRGLLRKFAKYIVSSLSSTIVDLVVFYFMIKILKPSFPLSYIFIATLIARVISGLINYSLNHFFVFKSTNNKAKTLSKYFTLSVFDMVSSGLLVTLLVNLLVILPETVVKIIVDLTLFFLGYYIQRKYIF